MIGKNEYPSRQSTMTEIERAANALLHLDAGCGRDLWIRAGMAAKSAGLSFDEFHRWSASGSNYAGENECRIVWKSFDESGAVTPATLFGMAFAQGWKDPNASYAMGDNRTRPSPALAMVERTAQKPVKQAVSKNAVQVWGWCVPADMADAYIHRKQGNPDGLRIYPASAPPLVICGQNVKGYLVVPCWDGDDLQTLQFIPPGRGNKLNLPGASFNDGFFTVGEISGRIYVCEGVGQAWALNRATGAAAVACFGAGRMAMVAEVLRDKFASAFLIVVSDRGKENQAAAIAAAVAGHWVEMPLDKPANYDANDYAQEFGSGALADLVQRPLAPAMRFKLLSDGELNALPPLEWRIKKVLPSRGLAAVFGASGSGKSFLVLDALQSMAIGNNWFGHKSKPCNIIYCALEGEGGIAGRVNAYRIRHGETAANIRYLVQPFNLLNADDINGLAQAIMAGGNNAEVVVLDTLNRATSGADENDGKSMGQIIAASKHLQMLVGGLIVLVHHTGKDTSRGLRGHSSLLAALDSAIEVRRDGDRREWLIAKSKDGEDGEVHPFKLEVVELGTDENTELITSCVIRREEKADNIRSALAPKSGNQRIVWIALGEVFRKAGTARPKGAPDTLPQGRPCILLQTAIDKTRTRLVCEPKRQTERAQAAIRGLIERQFLCYEGGFLWCK